MLSWRPDPVSINHVIKSEDRFHCFSIYGAEISYILDIAHKLDGRRNINKLVLKISCIYFHIDKNLTENFL